MQRDVHYGVLRLALHLTGSLSNVIQLSLIQVRALLARWLTSLLLRVAKRLAPHGCDYTTVNKVLL